MRRETAAAAVGVLLVVVLLTAIGVVVRRNELDALLVQETGLIVPEETFSRIAADRPCPELDDAEPPPRRVLAPLRLAEVDGTEASPTSLALIPGDSGDGFLARRQGQIVRVADGQVTDDIVLDLTDDTAQTGDGGLLALAVDPSGAWLYVVHTTAGLDDVLSAYPIADDGSLDVAGGRDLVRSGHPESIQHHGGSLAFDHDGHLFVGFGDGGGLGDPRENGQRLTTLLGKILRVVPTPDGEAPYEVPPDNPFVGREDARPEIWAYGVRNPFRMTYDAATDDLWVVDVGQSCWEEVNRLPTGPGGAAGANLGWDIREGTQEFEGGGGPGELLDPVWQINHRHGWCAAAIGPLVRAPTGPGLTDRLLLIDYCKGDLWALDPANPTDVIDTGLHVDNPIAVVMGPDGRPWILTLEDGAYEVRTD